MADSTLTRTGETPAGTGKGHGTDALGPSDSSDSGSDLRGGPGFGRDERWGLAREPNAAGDSGDGDNDAGPDVGDLHLDSDSDRFGTGERAASGRDSTGPVDQTLYDDRGKAVDGEDIADDSSLDTTLQTGEDAGRRDEIATGGFEQERDSTVRGGRGDVEREKPSSERGRRDDGIGS